MDIICPVCGEPWDMDELHDVPGASFKQAYARFRTRGCEVFDTRHSELANSDAARASSVLMDLLGDDVDGVAAMTEDLGLDSEDFEL